jgi:hypothetical protein
MFHLGGREELMSLPSQLVVDDTYPNTPQDSVNMIQLHHDEYYFGCIQYVSRL